MKRTAVFAVSAALMLAVQPAAAQDVLPRPLGPMESFLFSRGSGVKASWGNVHVGPYQGVVASMMISDPTQPQITLYCVDFAHSIHKDQTWNANITNLAGGSFTNTRMSDVSKYKKAAFLASLYDSYADFANNTTFESTGLFTDQATVWSGIQAAIWATLTPGFGTASLEPGAWVYADPFVALANAAMQNNYAGTGMNFSEWSVVSDKCNDAAYAETHVCQIGGVQEYLVHTVVPEPETVFLMMTGLLAVAVGALKFRVLDTG